MNNPIIPRILKRINLPGLDEILIEKVKFSELQSLLLDVFNHRYETPKQALETNSAAELRGIIPSDFVGIVRLTNFSSLTPEI